MYSYETASILQRTPKMCTIYLQQSNFWYCKSKGQSCSPFCTNHNIGEHKCFTAWSQQIWSNWTPGDNIMFQCSFHLFNIQYDLFFQLKYAWNWFINIKWINNNSTKAFSIILYKIIISLFTKSENLVFCVDSNGTSYHDLCTVLAY